MSNLVLVASIVGIAAAALLGLAVLTALLLLTLLWARTRLLLRRVRPIPRSSDTEDDAPNWPVNDPPDDTETDLADTEITEPIPEVAP